MDNLGIPQSHQPRLKSESVNACYYDPIDFAASLMIATKKHLFGFKHNISYGTDVIPVPVESNKKSNRSFWDCSYPGAQVDLDKLRFFAYFHDKVCNADCVYSYNAVDDDPYNPMKLYQDDSICPFVFVPFMITEEKHEPRYIPVTQAMWRRQCHDVLKKYINFSIAEINYIIADYTIMLVWEQEYKLWQDSLKAK